jgi:hypothetical protein
MYVYEEIRDELKKYKYIIYTIKNNKYELGIKFKGTKNELFDKIEKKYKNAYNDYYVCFKFSFHTGNKPLQGGPISITISSLEIINNKVKTSKQINGKVWFQKKYIEKFGWNDKYFNMMLNNLIPGKVKLNPLVVNMFNVYFE